MSALGTETVAIDDVRAAGPVTASLTFAWRSLLKLRRLPEELSDTIAIPIIFQLMFTYLFGGALAGSTGRYLQYLEPGTLVLGVVMITVYTGVTLNADMAGGAFDRYRSLPIWRPAPIVGGLIGDAGRYLLAAGLVIGLGLLMGFHPPAGAPGLLAAVGLLLVFAFGLGWGWTALGLVARSPRAIMGVGFTVLFPVTFASNIFVAPRTLPGWLHTFVDVNPVSHLVGAERGLIDGTATAGQVGWVLAASALMFAVFAPLTMLLYRRRS